MRDYLCEHPFFHRRCKPHVYTSERRAFERDVYDFSKTQGYPTEDARRLVFNIRRVLRKETGNDGFCSEYEGEIEDRGRIVKQLEQKLWQQVHDTGEVVGSNESVLPLVQKAHSHPPLSDKHEALPQKMNSREGKKVSSDSTNPREEAQESAVQTVDLETERDPKTARNVGRKSNKRANRKAKRKAQRRERDEDPRAAAVQGAKVHTHGDRSQVVDEKIVEPGLGREAMSVPVPRTIEEAHRRFSKPNEHDHHRPEEVSQTQEALEKHARQMAEIDEKDGGLRNFSDIKQAKQNENEDRKSSSKPWEQDLDMFIWDQVQRQEGENMKMRGKKRKSERRECEVAKSRDGVPTHKKKKSGKKLDDSQFSKLAVSSIRSCNSSNLSKQMPEKGPSVPGFQDPMKQLA